MKSYLMLPLLVCTMTMLTTVYSIVSVDIYWNKSNEIFQAGNNDHILELSPKDKINFHCPYDQTLSAPPKGFYIIYRVPKEYYDNCSLPLIEESHKLKTFGINRVTTCKDPSKSKMFTVVLEQFSALPGSHGGLTFQPGRTYYFISTSTGTIEGLDNTEAMSSSCLNDHMKFKLNVTHNNQANTPVMRQYTSTQRMRTTPTTESVHNSQVVTPTAHVRRHNSRPQLSNGRPPLPDYSIVLERTTTAFNRKKFPPAIIDAAVTLNTVSSARSSHAGYHVLVIFLSLLHILLHGASSLR